MNQRKYTKKKMAMKDCKESRERKSIRSIVRSQSRKQKPVMRYVLWAFHCSIRRFVLSDCTSTGSTDCSETKTNTSFYSLDINLNPRLASPMLWGVKAGYAFSTFFFFIFFYGDMLYPLIAGHWKQSVLVFEAVKWCGEPSFNAYFTLTTRNRV